MRMSITYQLMEVRSNGARARCANGVEGNDAVQWQAYLLGCCNGGLQCIRMSDKNRRFGRGKLIGQFVGGIRRVGAASWQISSCDNAVKGVRSATNVTMAPSLCTAQMTVG